MRVSEGAYRGSTDTRQRGRFQEIRIEVSSMGITSDYVDFCLGLAYEDLPSEVVEYVKQLGLDLVGTAAYGTLADSSKTYCHHDPEPDKLLPGKFPGRAVIQMKDARKFENTYEIPNGDGKNPLSPDELREKYKPLARSIFSEKQVKEIEERTMNLEGIRDFTPVLELLFGKGG